eukprot:XP_024999212.1 sperm-associated antigen 4 protein-like [Gallus gallus]
MLAHGRTAGPGGHQAACQNPALLCHSGAHHPEMTPSGTASSAPRDVAVFGLDADSEEEVPLVSFTFDVGEGPTQTFLLKNNHSRAFRYIKVLVKSNWGHPRYTCLYRVQVHGKVVKTEDVEPQSH